MVLGLGNPGQKYEGTRHNVGRDAVMALAERAGITLGALKHDARYGTGNLAGARVCLAVTSVYMNESGRPAAALSRFYRVPPQRLLVVYDEMDLPLGTLKLREGGGTGGHNGIADIIRLLGTRDFPRLRLGIERPPPGWDKTGWVLGRFDKEEAERAAVMVDEAGPIIEHVLREGVRLAMNRHHRRAK
jgi:PTH1 family peptidyl-tRNA hydrolase